MEPFFFFLIFPPDPNSDADVLKTILSGKNDALERVPDLENQVLRFRFKA